MPVCICGPGKGCGIMGRGRMNNRADFSNNAGKILISPTKRVHFSVFKLVLL